MLEFLNQQAKSLIKYYPQTVQIVCSLIVPVLVLLYMSIGYSGAASTTRRLSGMSLGFGGMRAGLFVFGILTAAATIFVPKLLAHYAQ